MLILYIILAHLIADFLLQPHCLVRFKEKSFFGVLLHSVIHLAVSLLVLMPYLNQFNVLIAVFVLFLLHMIIDQGKISMQLKTDKYFHPFLTDQLFHFLAIFFVYKIFELKSLETAVSQSLYFNRNTPLFLITLVFFIAVYDIARFQLAREKQKRATYSLNVKNLGIKILLAFFVFLGFALFGYFSG